MDMTPHFNFVKQYSGYHYDRNQPDEGLIFKKKFDGVWEEELNNFVADPGAPVNFGDPIKRLQTQEWINLGYRFSKDSNIMRRTVLDDRFPQLQKIESHFQVEKKSIVTQQKPFDMLPYHHDIKLGGAFDDREKIINEGYRIIIFLTDWEPGQYLIWGNTTIEKWEAGYILGWPSVKFPHGSCNISPHTAYRLRINALMNQECLDFLNDDTIIKV